MDFQQAVMRLNQFWADRGCILWQPHNVQVGAGTLNPATVLRVLGPEPWHVAYVEPSVRPDDGRYGENPNRWHQFFQYQVILKPDPGNPQEIYLDSLRALGIDTTVHDVRFVEDNWQSPVSGAWGLGWEVWLDGQEITQYTYFQQAGGISLDPVSVEITYGLERIVMVLQGARTFNDMVWRDGITYGQMLLRGEIEACTYNFEVADVDNLHRMYDLCEAEAKNALARGLVMPAHDYVLKCSHLFNVLDARGAVGVTERARYFARMRDLSREVSLLFVKQREEAGYPFLQQSSVGAQGQYPESQYSESQYSESQYSESQYSESQYSGSAAAPPSFTFLLEIGTEELPVADLDDGLDQLQRNLSAALSEARLPYERLVVQGTPRRLVARVEGLAARQGDQERVVKGPAARIAYDERGNPTKAALGFARGQGVDVSTLQLRVLDGREYAVSVAVQKGREAGSILAEVLPSVVGSLRFTKSMRWNASGAGFSRPLRWIVALLDKAVVPFEVAGVSSGRISRGIRSLSSPPLSIAAAADYPSVMAGAGIMLDVRQREESILSQAHVLAAEVGGVLPEDADLLREVANLVEYPLAIRGAFAQEYLWLPDVVLLAVMRKHQRYLPLVRDGKLLPYFIAVANGANLDVAAVRYGNEEVLRARYADAAYFYAADSKRRLDDFAPRLATLTFQEQLGSMADKVQRIQRLVPQLCSMLGLSAQETAFAARAAALCKNDLATQLVVELTSLQGEMGRHYALSAGEPPEVALAIAEHYLPRSMGDRLPTGKPGLVVGLADRLDTLVGLFAVGARPSGAADPWGLRRAALGIVQVLVAREVSLALPEIISLAAGQLPVAVEEAVLREVLDFVAKRFRGYLLDSGFRYDMVDAVLAERGYDPSLAYRTLRDFIPWVERPDWRELLDNYARCVRITRDQQVIYSLDPSLLSEPASQALYQAYRRVAGRLSRGARPCAPSSSMPDDLFQALLELVPLIQRFFEDILVMAEGQALRQSRLGLLQAISALPRGILDLTVMEGF